LKITSIFRDQRRARSKDSFVIAFEGFFRILLIDSLAADTYTLHPSATPWSSSGVRGRQRLAWFDAPSAALSSTAARTSVHQRLRRELLGRQLRQSCYSANTLGRRLHLSSRHGRQTRTAQNRRSQARPRHLWCATSL